MISQEAPSPYICIGVTAQPHNIMSSANNSAAPLVGGAPLPGIVTGGPSVPSSAAGESCYLRLS